MKKPFLIHLLLALAFAGKLAAQAPVISSFSPASGPVGTTVTINGTGFNSAAANDVIFFGGVKAAPVSATATTIVVKVPAGASYQPLTVLNLANHLSGYSAKAFDVTFAGGQPISTTEFDPKFLLPQGILPASVNLVDIDMDGKPDLVVGCSNSQDISIYRNIGTAGTLNENSFAPKISIVLNNSYTAVVKISDLDGDGKPDVIIAAVGGFVVLHNSSIPGTVGIAAPVFFSTGGTPLALGVGDIDGDGRPDVAAIVKTSGANILSVFKNTSSGGVINSSSFDAGTTIVANTPASLITLSDIDADGKPDMVLVNRNLNSISIMRNTSTAASIAFDANIDFACGQFPWDVAAADLDGDGKPDLAVSNSNSNTISVYFNQSASGAFTSATLAAKIDLPAANAPSVLNIADMDGDGKPEILVGNGGSVSISIFHNLAVAGSITANSFEPKVDFSVQTGSGYGHSINAVGVADMDGDGKPDMAVIGDSVAVFHYNPVYAPVITGISPDKGAINGTVTITGQNFNAVAANNTVSFGPVQAKVNTASATQLTVTIPAGATYGAFSVFNAGSRLTAYSPMPFTPTFTSKHALSNLDFEPKVALATMQNISGLSFHDIDGDGRLDMIISNYNTSGYVVASVYRNVSASGSISAASFPAKLDFATRGQPQSAIFKDINGDGKPDMLIFGKANQIVTCYLNKAVPGTISTASFAPGIELGEAFSATDVTFADLDGDGRPDMISTDGPNNSNASFFVARNISSGGQLAFADNIIYKNVVTYNMVAAGDIDGDGKPDLVMAGPDSTISIYQNLSVNGNITMGDKVNISLGKKQVWFIRLADIDGDGKPDIIVTYHQGSFDLGNSVSVFRNISSTGAITAASFAAPVDFAIGATSLDLSFADIDGDGKPDMVLNDGAASVLLNNSTTGTISFTSKVNLPDGLGSGPDYSSYLSVYDLDGDGKPDMVFSDPSNQSVWFIHNKPQAATPVVAAPAISSFTPAIAPNGASIVVNGANFNGNAASNAVYLGATQAKVLTASDTQLTVQVPAGSTYFPLSVINKANGLQAASLNPFVNTFKSGGALDSTSFKGDVNISGQWSTGASAIGDLDGDGKPDVVFTDAPGNVYKLEVTRNVTKVVDTIAFAPIVSYDVPTSIANIILADIDGDGKLDVVVTYGSDNYDSFSIFRNTSTVGNITFAPQLDVHFAAATIAIGDVNGDGKPDIIATIIRAGNQAYAFRNTSTPGNISFASPDVFGTHGDGAMGITDIDGDGKPDLVIANVDIVYNQPARAVSVLRNNSANGGIAFFAPVDFATGSGSYTLKIGDLDGDGKPDLITCDTYKGSTISILNNISSPGTIAFKAHQDYAANEIGFITLGDVTGDGKPDILASGSTSNVIAAYQNNSTPGKIAFGPHTDFKPAPSPQFVSVGDLNGDGKADLVVSYNQSTIYVTTSGMVVLKNNIQTVPIPTITANGPLTFARGKNVILTAHPDTGFTYQWLLDGAKIPNATTNMLTAKKSGSYTVTIQLDTVSKTSAATVVNVVFALPADNFQLTISSASCKGSNNGSVGITAKETMDYTATIMVNGQPKAYPFTTSATIPGLAAGSYPVCITVAGQPDYQQCFDVVITEPKDLSLYSTVNDADKTVTLLLGGGTQYHIKLNGNNYTTTDNAITLPLSQGNNQVEVTTDKLCQGLITKVINYSGAITPYPVPFANNLNLNLGNDNIGSVSVTINNAEDGTVVFSKKYVNQSGVLQLDVSGLKSGVYGLHLVMDGTEKVFKIIRQ